MSLYVNSRELRSPALAIAPMMDWTDRHCRYFHRLLAPRALLYSEMIVADAIIHGDRDRLLGFSPYEHPLALQLGGSDPARLADAARIGEQFGYDEINLNVGCPSDRVRSGTFGACLMLVPQQVAECVHAMKQAVTIPVTVKCRLGVDQQDTESALDTIADAVFSAGGDALWVHARKAWLQGLSPKENRQIPPLDYDRVYRLKARLPHRFIGINGGIGRPEAVALHLEKVDGVMIGRAAYGEPGLLAALEAAAQGIPASDVDYAALLQAMRVYCDNHIAAGGRLSHVTRHMVGLFAGVPGAKRYRQILSVDATKAGATSDVLARAFDAVLDPDIRAAA